MCHNVDIGLVRPEGHPCMFVRLVVGEDPRLIRALEGKVARLTQRVPTLRIEHIPAVMQEFVVGVPPVWLRLLRRVSKVQRDHGDQGGPSDQGGPI